jgi:hypothetical protein
MFRIRHRCDSLGEPSRDETVGIVTNQEIDILRVHCPPRSALLTQRDARQHGFALLELQDAQGRQKVGQLRRSEAERATISVLVAPHLTGPVSPRSRSLLAEALPPVWVPAMLQPDGTLLPDPEHLPFIPRAVLAPPLRRSSWGRAGPVAELRDYDAIITAMVVDREENWQTRIAHAEEMFLAVHGLWLSAWLPAGWQRHKPIVVLWDRQSGFAHSVLNLVDEWSAAAKMAGCLALAALGRQGDPIDPSAEQLLQLGHAGAAALNLKQREAFRAVASPADGHVQAVNGPPGTGKTSLLKA